MSVVNLQNNDLVSADVMVLLKEATALHQSEKYEEAIKYYKTIIQINPDLTAAWSNLGTALRQMGHTAGALACAKRALALSPDSAAHLTNYGNVLSDLDQESMALEAQYKALQLRPDDFLVRKNFAITLREFGHYEESLVHFEVACKMQPHNAAIRWDRAITYLHAGRFKEGWDAFEIRLKIGAMNNRSNVAPIWQGEPLVGKTLLIHGEQGFGDTILCSRYIPLIKSLGSQIFLECAKPLHRLFSAIPGIDKIAEYGQIKNDIDYEVSIMSLPHRFKTDLQSIPVLPSFYIPEKAPHGAQKLIDAAGDKFKVGVIWSGSTTFKGNAKRAVSVDRFIPLAAVPGVQLYSIQKGPCEKALYDAHADGLIWDLSEYLNDFAETAAILKSLDLVIMTDSSVAHLAGSIGCPVWNLLCYKPYWLYLSYSEECAWYPSMRLIRQPTPGNWDAVFEKVALELEKAVLKKKR